MQSRNYKSFLWSTIFLDKSKTTKTLILMLYFSVQKTLSQLIYQTNIRIATVYKIKHSHNTSLMAFQIFTQPIPIGPSNLTTRTQLADVTILPKWTHFHTPILTQSAKNLPRPSNKTEASLRSNPARSTTRFSAIFMGKLL